MKIHLIIGFCALGVSLAANYSTIIRHNKRETTDLSRSKRFADVVPKDSLWSIVLEIAEDANQARNKINEIKSILYYSPMKITEKNADGNTALHLATLIADTDVAKSVIILLLKNGASPDIRNKMGKRPWEYSKISDNTIDGMLRPNDIQLQERHHFGRSHSSDGSRSSYQELLYQQKLAMLLVLQGIRNDESFKIATDVSDAGLFDDIVYKVTENEKKRVAFQVKYKRNENTVITENDLLALNTYGEFDLQKYFDSYRKIENRTNYDDLVIATNIDLEENLKWNFEENHQHFLKNVDSDLLKPKTPAFYKFKSVGKSSVRLRLEREFRKRSDRAWLIETLYDHIMNKKMMTLNNELFKKYHIALFRAKIIDPLSMVRLHTDFMNNPTNLGQDAQQFRTDFEMYHKDNDPKTNIWAKLNDLYKTESKIKISKTFGQKCVLSNDLEMSTSNGDTISGIVELVTRFRHAINNAKYKTIDLKTSPFILRMTGQTLAGHVIVAEHEETRIVNKFSSKFLDTSDTSLPPNVLKFRKRLRTELNDIRKSQIRFGDLFGYTILIGNDELIQICEDGQQNVDQTLPKNDDVTSDEINDFFAKLTFAVNLPNQSQLTKIIIEESKMPQDKFEIIKQKHAGYQIFAGIADWFRDNEGKIITEESATQMFKVMTDDYLKPIFHNVVKLNDNFVGRTAELAELMNNRYQVSVISGLGGVGKTQLAAKLAQNYAQNQSNVVWINAESPIAIEKSFIDLARSFRLSIPTHDSLGNKRDVLNIIQDIYHFLSDSMTLYIFDNVDRFSSITKHKSEFHKYVPLNLPKEKFKLLKIEKVSATSKKPDDNRIILLGELKPEEAEQIVKNSLSFMGVRDENNALVVNFHVNPLALQQSITYIKKQLSNGHEQYSTLEYMTNSNNKLLELLASTKAAYGTDNAKLKVYSTIKVILDEVITRSFGKQANNIFIQMGYLRSENIPIELFTSTDTNNEHAVNLLKDYSMIDETDGKLSIQPCVQNVIRTIMVEKNKNTDILRGVIMLFSDIDKMPAEYIDHVTSVWSHVYELENANIVKEFVDHSEKLINRLTRDGRHDDAIYFGESAIPHLKNMFNEDNKITLNIELLVAKTLLNNGEYAKVIAICENILERGQGNDITDLKLNTYLIMALALKGESKFAQAQQTLEMANQLSTGHNSIRVHILHELAQLHSVNNQNDQAMKYFSQITEIPRNDIELPQMEKLCIIGESYSQIGEYDKAIELYKQAQRIDGLTIQEGWTIASKIAASLREKQKWLSFNNYETLLQAMEKVVKDNNPMLMDVELRMAQLRDELGDTNAALKIYRRNRKRRGGKNRPYNRIIGAINTRIKELENNIPEFTLSSALSCLASTKTPNCHFSKADVQKFTVGEIDVNHPEKWTIDTQKFLEFIRSKNDAEMNSQLFELIRINHQLESNVYDANLILLSDTIFEFEMEFCRRMIDVAVSILSLGTTLTSNNLSWKSKALDSMNKIIVYDSIRYAGYTCKDSMKGGDVVPCAIALGAVGWVFISDSITDGIINYSSKILSKVIPKIANRVDYALSFALRHASGRLATTGARLGISYSLLARTSGKTISRVAAGMTGAVFDAVSIAYSAYILGKCSYNANTDAQCSDKDIRDNVVNIVLSSVSFVAGIAALASGVPVVGILISFGIVVARATYSIREVIIEQIDQIDSQIHTNFDEDTTFAYLFKFSRDTYKIESIPLISTWRYFTTKFGDNSKQSDVVKRGAEFVWKSLQAESSNVAAYGVGLGSHAKIRLDEANKANTRIGGIIPKGSNSNKEYFEPICLSHDSESIDFVNEKVIDSAVYYCENALVISDNRRSKGNTIILNLGQIETGEIIGSNQHINIFLCFHGTYNVIGGKSTTNVFMFINNKIDHKPRIIGGLNATNIIDFSQNIHRFYNETGMEIGFQYKRGHVQTYTDTYVPHLNDNFDENFDNRTYKYVGRPHEMDKVSCSIDGKTDRILIDSGGGTSDRKDIIYNCNRAFVSPFTIVVGDQDHQYEMYVRTTGYNGTDLITSFDITNGFTSMIFLDLELIGKFSRMKYDWDMNVLQIIMAFGSTNENLFHVTIDNYLIDLEMKRPTVSLFDKNNRRIVPKIPEPASKDENSNNKIIRSSIDSYEIFANCPSSCDRLIFDDSQANLNCECSDLLNITKQINALTCVSIKDAGDLFIGSHQNDLMYINDAVRFAKGLGGSDTYIVMDSQNHTSNRTFDILNCAPDNEIDVVHLPNVPATYSIHLTDLIVHADGVKVRVHRFMTSTQCRHLTFINANKETFIAPILTPEYVSGIKVEKFARFLYSTPSQITIILPRHLQSERIVIDAVPSELKLYKNNNDLLIMRESHNQLVIQIQHFYSNRSKWENIEWFLHNDGIFTEYDGLEFVDDDVTDYAEKIKCDYSNDIKDYVTDFSDSYSISHNHLDYIKDRTGVLKIENLLPNRIAVESDGNKLVFIDRDSTNKITIEDWNQQSYRISMLVFNFIKPITIYGLDRYGLDQVNIIQELIFIAAESHDLQNEMDALVAVGVQCLIAIDGVNQTIPPYQCGGFNTIEEQFDFVNKYCTNETLNEFRGRATVEKVEITAQSLLNDITLKRGIIYGKSEYENSYQMCTNQTIRISRFVKLLKEVTPENHGAQLGDEFDIVSEFLYWSNDQKQIKLNPKQILLNNQLLDYMEKSPNISVKHVKSLVEQGANVEIRNSAKQTLLHLAVLKSEKALIEYLTNVLTVASINAVDNSGATALDYAFEMIQTQFCDVKQQKANKLCNFRTMYTFNYNDIIYHLREKGATLNRVQ